MDSMEATQSPSRSSQQLHFYLAVDRPQFKMETVVELLGVLGRRPWLPIVVCCSSRDELDAVCSSLSNLPYISLAALRFSFVRFFKNNRSIVVCKSKPLPEESLSCSTCVTPWHVSCLTSPHETLASTLQWLCPDCSGEIDPRPVSGVAVGYGSTGSDLVATICAIEADESLSDVEKAKKRQHLLGGKDIDEDDDQEEKKRRKGKNVNLDELSALGDNLKCSFCMQLPEKPVTYSDLADRERSMVIEKFRQATINWNQQLNSAVEEGLGESETGKEENKSHLVVVTDVCLPFLSSGEAPLSARVLINYELPTKKETYTRRITTCLASGGIVINMVVGGEVTTLKSLEESSGIIIAEMPINISEIF